MIAGIYAALRSESTAAGLDLSDGQISALNRPASSGDLLPGRLLSSPGAKLVAVASARRSQVDGNEELFVAHGTDDNSVCLVVSLNQDDSPMSCGSRELLKESALYIAVPSKSGAGIDVYGLVGNGVDTAGAATVVDNTFVLRGLTSPEIDIVGASAKETLDLSSSFTR